MWRLGRCRDGLGLVMWWSMGDKRGGDGDGVGLRGGEIAGAVE